MYIYISNTFRLILAVLLFYTHSDRHFSSYIVSQCTFVTYITLALHCFLHHRSTVIGSSGFKMSLVKIIYRLASLLEFNLIINHYCVYVNVFLLMHLTVLEFTSIGLALVRFTLKNGAGVPENCLF